MPVEVLTREEIERLVQEVVQRFLEQSGYSRRLSELEVTVNDLRSATLSPPAPSVPVYEGLMADLGERSRLLEVDSKTDVITLRPKGWLRSEDFRAISETIRKHGGAWSSMKKAFTVSRSDT